MADPDPSAIVGTSIADRYRVEEILGSGGFAWVFRGITPQDTRVAIKVLHSTDRMALARFRREIKVLKSLTSNPHVVEYIDDGLMADGRPFLVLGYLDGKTLADEMSRWRQLEPRDAVSFLSELCEAFVELHGLGVAHRDVKPENIILTAQGGIKLIDLGLIRDAQGILKLLEQDEQLEGRIFQDEIDRWTIAGTPEYMAPEQFSDGIAADPVAVRTDTWTDVFSLGVILHELISGTVPFPVTDSPEEVGGVKKALYKYMLWRMQATDRDVPHCRGVDRALDSILRKALRSEPRQRQPNAGALRDDLQRYLETGRGVRRSYDTFTQAMTAGDIKELELQRQKTKAAIKAMETALKAEDSSRAAAAAPEEEPDAEHDGVRLEDLAENESDLEDADTIAKPRASQTPDAQPDDDDDFDSEDTIARRRSTPAPDAPPNDDDIENEDTVAGARVSLSMDSQADPRPPAGGGPAVGARSGEDAFVIIDLPPPRSARGAVGTDEVEDARVDPEEDRQRDTAPIPVDPPAASKLRHTFVVGVEEFAEPKAKADGAAAPAAGAGVESTFVVDVEELAAEKARADEGASASASGSAKRTFQARKRKKSFVLDDEDFPPSVEEPGAGRAAEAGVEDPEPTPTKRGTGVD